jgi:hypothetical protein
MTLYELCDDLRNIMRGGIASKDDTISPRQIALWIRSVYAQKAQEAIVQTPTSLPVNDTWTQRYTCIPLVYPADAPCGCEKDGFWAGRVDLPSLLTREGRQAVERVQLEGYGKSLIRGTVDTVKGIVSGSGLQSRLRASMLLSAYYPVGRKLYVIGNPEIEKPKNITLHLAQADPILNLSDGEIEFEEEMGDREVPYPLQFQRLLRLEILTAEARAMIAGLAVQDVKNNNDAS